MMDWPEAVAFLGFIAVVVGLVAILAWYNDGNCLDADEETRLIAEAYDA